MGRFADHLVQEVRLERMRPEQIEAAKAQQPVIYVACGSIEWHGYQNPVGLDALKAHEQLVGLAERAGGLVYPPLFLGAGGGHIGWPDTFMVDAEPLARILQQLLHGFERDGYRKVVLLSGHYPNLTEYMRPGMDAYLAAGGSMQVLALIENQVPGVGGDHAAKYETSFMLYLYPELVNMERLRVEPRDDVGGPDETIDFMVDAYRGHPCYGLVGIDPRGHASAGIGRSGTERLIEFLARWVRGD